ncbi:CD63 antigen [Monodelphis domestica]|uniref:CD63 antigen n=1 Tax=Monodelphis domestica TaxID=13616 RepID=UPI0024E1A28F|nr:CD63 antigen [Monodelphis domestica]XP_056653946.1 CD63 antigen [Monodelphis domestica]
MAVEGGMKCVKFLLYVLVLAFWACAVGLIAVGVAVQFTLNHTIPIGATAVSVVPVVIIAVGAFLFLVSFLGCCATCKENYCLMTTFAIFLSLIVLVEVAATIAGYIFRDKVKSEFEAGFRDQMKEYEKNNATAQFLDELQEEFNCCGAANYTDWEHIPLTPKNRVPDSCCVNVTLGCGSGFKPSDINQKGCVESIGNWLKQKALVLAGVALGITFVEILGVIFACCLMKSIRSGYEVM